MKVKVKKKDKLDLTAEQWVDLIMLWFTGKKATESQLDEFIRCLEKVMEDK